MFGLNIHAYENCTDTTEYSLAKSKTTLHIADMWDGTFCDLELEDMLKDNEKFLCVSNITSLLICNSNIISTIPNHEHPDEITAVSMANVENGFCDIKLEDVTEMQGRMDLRPSLAGLYCWY